MSRRLASLALAGLLLAASAGCGGGSDPDQDSSSSSTGGDKGGDKGGAKAGDQACTSLLSEDEVKALAGTDLGAGQASSVSIPACRWGGTDKVGVQVVNLPADQWAEQLPALIQQYRSSGPISDKQEKKLRRGENLIASDKGIDADDACQLFSTLIEIQGMAKGSSQVTNLIPDRKQPHGVSAQECSDGVFTSVTLVSRDVLSDPKAAVKRTETARDAVTGS